MRDGMWITDTEPSSRFPVYTRLNAADVMAHPMSPLAASMCWIPSILPGWATSYVAEGCYFADELTEAASVAGIFYGHLYINQSSVRIMGIRKGLTWQEIDHAYFNSPGAPEHAGSPSDFNAELVRIGEERIRWVLTTSHCPEIEEDAATANRLRIERPNLKALSNLGLVARARSVMPYERLSWRSETVGSSNAPVGAAVAASMLGEDKAHLLTSILGHAGDVESAAPAYALWALSRTVRADQSLSSLFDSGVEQVAAELPVGVGTFWLEFATFIAEFGFRGPSEWDLGVDSWETDPTLALALVDRLRHLPDTDSPAARQATHALATEAAMAEALAGMDEESRKDFRGAVASTRRFSAWREKGKSSCVKVIHEARVALLELGVRLAAQGILDHPRQIFVALDDELDALAVCSPGLREVLVERERQWRALADLDLPTFLDTSQGLAPLSALPRKSRQADERVAAGTVLSGAAASQGIAEGKARIVRSTAEIGSFEAGEILVAPQTDPSWTPLFLVSAGVVVNTGSTGSHAMIVARELGIPCVAGLPGATEKIRTGDLLRVDGSLGTVEVIGTA